jgi:hypothetical protein
VAAARVGAGQSRVPVSSALTLRTLLKSASARLGAGFADAHVTGLSAAAKAFLIAASASREPDAATRHHAALLVIVPSDADVEQTTADVRFFLGALEGDVAPAVEHAVLPFLAGSRPYRGLAPHLQVASARARRCTRRHAAPRVS